MMVTVAFPFQKTDALGQPEGDFLKVGDVVELDDEFAQRKIRDGHAVSAEGAQDVPAPAAEGTDPRTDPARPAPQPTPQPSPEPTPAPQTPEPAPQPAPTS